MGHILLGGSKNDNNAYIYICVCGFFGGICPVI